jgi:hypothetical protein
VGVREGGPNGEGINRLYVDGVEVDSAQHTYVDHFGSDTAPLNLGWLNLSPFYNFEGTLDEVALYNRALAAAEVSEHYNNGLVGKGYCVAPPETVEVPLLAGWNLVSFHLQPVNTDIAAVLSSVEGNYDLVYAWDAQNQRWLKYDNIPLSPDTLTDLDETMGFWIHVTSPDTLVVAGSLPTTTDIHMCGTGAGWNLVGYPSTSAGDLPDVMEDHGVGTDFSLVYAYHAADAADPWKLFDRMAPSWANDLTALTAGWGYWVKVSQTCTWDVTCP